MTASTILGPNGEPIRHCAHPGCSNLATVYPQVIVPPRGYPAKQGFKTVVGIGLCLKHGREEVPGTFLTDEFRRMAQAVVASSPIPLDFDRTEIKLRPLGDKPWRDFTSAAIAARKGRTVH